MRLGMVEEEGGGGGGVSLGLTSVIPELKQYIRADFQKITGYNLRGKWV